MSRKGFASMDPERVKEIASQGGKASAASGRAHRFTPEEARRAGALGGRVVSTRPGGREHMAAIGQRGGIAVSSDREHMREIARGEADEPEGEEASSGTWPISRRVSNG